MRTIFVTALLALLATGCAAPGMYQWGGYEQGLYDAYKDPTQIENLRVKLETHIAAMESASQKVAPGLYAELGTIYLQSGATDKAIVQYRKERDAWPESRGLMTAMIQNLERHKQASLEVTK